jgi:hypothetical protein
MFNGNRNRTEDGDTSVIRKCDCGQTKGMMGVRLRFREIEKAETY